MNLMVSSDNVQKESNIINIFMQIMRLIVKNNKNILRINYSCYYL